MKRTSPLRRTPLRRVSKKRAKQLRDYSVIRAAFLLEHPVCEVWMKENGWKRTDGARIHNEKPGHFDASAQDLFDIGAPRSVEIHHRNRRNGARLNDPAYFIAVSRTGHEFIHNNPSKAREMGLLA